MLSEVEQEQRPSGNGDRQAIFVGACLCDGEGERAYTVYDPISGEEKYLINFKRFWGAKTGYRTICRKTSCNNPICRLWRTFCGKLFGNLSLSKFSAKCLWKIVSYPQPGNHRHRGWSAVNWKVSRINRQWIHFSIGGLGSTGLFRREQRKFHHASLWSALLFARRSTSWQLFESADFNGSSERQCGLCSRNCERKRCVRINILHVVRFFKNLYIIAALKISTSRMDSGW